MFTSFFSFHLSRSSSILKSYKFNFTHFKQSDCLEIWHTYVNLITMDVTSWWFNQDRLHKKEHLEGQRCRFKIFYPLKYSLVNNARTKKYRPHKWLYVSNERRIIPLHTLLHKIWEGMMVINEMNYRLPKLNSSSLSVTNALPSSWSWSSPQTVPPGSGSSQKASAPCDVAVDRPSPSPRTGRNGSLEVNSNESYFFVFLYVVDSVVCKIFIVKVKEKKMYLLNV